MSLYKNSSFLVLLVLSYMYALVSSGEVNVSATESADTMRQASSFSPAAAAVVVVNSPVFEPGEDSLLSLNLLSSSPEDPEISVYCSELLKIFGQRYSAYVNCLATFARPVQVCQMCFSNYSILTDIYMNISSDQMGANESCRDSLLRSDRLMLVYLLYSNVKDIWIKSDCGKCITNGFQSLTNDTLYFLNAHTQTITCFNKYKQGNQTELCKDCKTPYRGLNELYSRMETNETMCIDIEDAMNMTRILWSKKYNCSFPREETVPVIAVSSFMLFLPIIFYLSSFLHSEQKKRKLIHPKRAKSYSSLMNIQSKLS
ncbi:osteopetrosis-associated transmembrane protein 1 [Anarhichas minor]|uniref:osteopetrosis-associated transmembrane protein 1 n=1 Tax=Anarhichas minor TaxID=65739 RepID=UPI003F734F83